MQCLLSCFSCCTRDNVEDKFKLAKRYLDAANSSCACCYDKEVFRKKGVRLLIDSAYYGYHQPAWIELARIIPTLTTVYQRDNGTFQVTTPGPYTWLEFGINEDMCRRGIQRLSTTGGQELEVFKRTLQSLEKDRVRGHQQAEQRHLEQRRQFEEAEQHKQRQQREYETIERLRAEERERQYYKEQEYYAAHPEAERLVRPEEQRVALLKDQVEETTRQTALLDEQTKLLRAIIYK